MVSILGDADQRAVPAVAKKQDASAQTICGWRKQFGMLELVDVKRLGSSGRRTEGSRPG